jgi:hypothetical protein
MHTVHTRLPLLIFHLALTIIRQDSFARLPSPPPPVALKPVQAPVEPKVKRLAIIDPNKAKDLVEAYVAEKGGMMDCMYEPTSTGFMCTVCHARVEPSA